MGLGKTIEGVGVSDIYHANPELFVKNVSGRFKMIVSQYYLEERSKISVIKLELNSELKRKRFS